LLSFTSECRVLALDVVCEVLVLYVVPAAHHKYDGVVEGRLKAGKRYLKKTQTIFVAQISQNSKLFDFF
jgi:regulator of sigma D